MGLAVDFGVRERETETETGKSCRKKSMCEFGFGDRAKVFLPLLEENGNKDKRTTTDDL